MSDIDDEIDSLLYDDDAKLSPIDYALKYAPKYRKLALQIGGKRYCDELYSHFLAHLPRLADWAHDNAVHRQSFFVRRAYASMRRYLSKLQRNEFETGQKFGNLEYSEKNSLLEVREWVQLIMSKLDEFDWEIIFMRVTLDIEFDEIGEAIGVTGERAGQLYREALQRARKIAERYQ